MKDLRRPGRKIFKVSELAGQINESLSGKFSEIWVQGEISGFTRHKSGHFFFALKDEKAKLEVVMFRFQALYMKYQPEDGLEALVRGRLSFYEPRGELRMIADAMEPVGVGALQLAFEQMRVKLESEGLFSLERKRPIPGFCRRVAVITSETGAVFQDMLRVFIERDARLQVLLIPSRVQGEGAEFELANAIESANRLKLKEPVIDVIVLARGGGSLEDLWPFNTEHLARAIFKSRLPVISAIGHEVDYTISDMVADMRALTPTAAAEMLAQSQQELIGRLEIAADNLKRRLVSELRYKSETIKRFLVIGQRINTELEALDKEIEFKKFRLGAVLSSGLQLKKESWRELSRELIMASPINRLQEKRRLLIEVDSGLKAAIKKNLGRNRETFMHLSGQLHALSPLSTLGRGYSITRGRKDQKLVKSVKDVQKGDFLEILLRHGELDARVENVKQKNLWEGYDRHSEDDQD